MVIMSGELILWPISNGNVKVTILRHKPDAILLWYSGEVLLHDTKPGSP